MTLRKAHLWISLVVGAGVWGAYFVHAVRALAGDRPGDLAWWFLGALVVVVLAETLATGLIAWLFRRRRRDLDDGPTLQAALRASHVALMLLIVLVLGAAGLMALASALGGGLDPGDARGQAIAANALLAMVVVAEGVRAAFTLALLPKD